jgi:hypothetical protein
MGREMTFYYVHNKIQQQTAGNSWIFIVSVEIVAEKVYRTVYIIRAMLTFVYINFKSVGLYIFMGKFYLCYWKATNSFNCRQMVGNVPFIDVRQEISFRKGSERVISYEAWSLLMSR